MRLFLFLIGFLFIQDNQAQIHVRFTIDGKPIRTEEKLYFESDTSWIQIDELKFYITYSPFFSDERENGSSIIHLVDIRDSASYEFPYTADGMKNNQFEFAIGLDSLTTMSTQFSGALDPALGMYWAWNTGYIHFKLEGKSNLCNTVKNEFLFHIGGYSGKFNTQRWFKSTISNDSKFPILNVELTDFLKDVLILNKNHNVMIPGKEALDISNSLFKLFN